MLGDRFQRRGLEVIVAHHQSGTVPVELFPDRLRSVLAVAQDDFLDGLELVFAQDGLAGDIFYALHRMLLYKVVREAVYYSTIIFLRKFDPKNKMGTVLFLLMTERGKIKRIVPIVASDLNFGRALSIIAAANSEEKRSGHGTYSY
jgi:hypothetical protein